VEQEVIRPVRSIALVLLLATRVAVDAAQPLPPELTQPVNDFAHVIDDVSKSEMERRILALKNATGDVVVVATIDTVAPYADINEYAVRMFENHGHGIGAKGKDNGLLILLAVKDRHVKPEVGYDLEQFITDGYSGEVSRTVMLPYFVRGEYGPGLLDGTTRFIARIAQGRGVTLSELPAVPIEPRDSGGGLPFSPGLIILIIIVLIVLSNMGNRPRFGGGRQRWGGGPWSGWNSGVGPFGGGGGFGGGGFGGGFGGFGGGHSGGGGAGAGW
jgi:uncharacterized protein